MNVSLGSTTMISASNRQAMLPAIKKARNHINEYQSNQSQLMRRDEKSTEYTTSAIASGNITTMQGFNKLNKSFTQMRQPPL